MENDKLLESLESLYQDLLWLDEELSSDLTKGPNYWKDKDPAKYRKMLNKLSSERKKPGSKERGYKGHRKDRDHSKTSSAVKRYASAEKKHGRKMSLDRKNNNKGYGSDNV